MKIQISEGFNIDDDEFWEFSLQHCRKHEPYWPSAKNLARVPLENMCYYSDPVAKKYCNDPEYISSQKHSHDFLLAEDGIGNIGFNATDIGNFAHSIIFCTEKGFGESVLKILNKYRQSLDSKLPLLTTGDVNIAREKLKGGAVELMPCIEGSKSFCYIKKYGCFRFAPTVLYIFLVIFHLAHGIKIILHAIHKSGY